MSDRDWALARMKLQREEGRCRVCRTDRQVQMAHIFKRWVDRTYADGTPQPKAWVVLPERVVPLCGPIGDPNSCHERYDTGRLDLLGHLSKQEEAQAVLDAGGLELARKRLCPSVYGPTKVAA